MISFFFKKRVFDCTNVETSHIPLIIFGTLLICRTVPPCSIHRKLWEPDLENILSRFLDEFEKRIDAHEKGNVLVEDPEEAVAKGAPKKKRYKSAVKIHASKRKKEESATAKK